MSEEAIVRQLTRSAISHLIARVMSERSLSMPDAMKFVYESSLFPKIQDPDTGLYREGPVFLYSLLCEKSAS